MAVEENAVFGMPLHGLGQCAGLNGAAHRDELLDRMAVLNPDDFLLNDGALIQHCRDVMGGGANDLHTAGMRLVVRLGALEGRQERMVDVDGAPGQVVAEVVGKHLHVAREHNEFDVELRHQREQLRLGVGLGVRGDRDVIKGDAVKLGERFQSLWLETIAGISTGRVPERCRNSRSLRQWAALDARIKVRTGAPARCRVHVSAKRSATVSRCSRRRLNAVVVSTATRMKKVPVSGLPYCWESVMLQPASNRDPETAWTMPGWSAQESVSTYPCVAAGVVTAGEFKSVTRSTLPSNSQLYYN